MAELKKAPAVGGRFAQTAEAQIMVQLIGYKVGTTTGQDNQTLTGGGCALQDDFTDDC